MKAQKNTASAELKGKKETTQQNETKNTLFAAHRTVKNRNVVGHRGCYQTSVSESPNRRSTNSSTTTQHNLFRCGSADCEFKAEELQQREGNLQRASSRRCTTIQVRQTKPPHRLPPNEGSADL